ncbi:hypothetical protein [Actinacidiphila yeochonensis]|uniref:hypothetical protein n=1 Tax=Actinacidiphila yeochonensis TaxID=89050 RepID=UPI00055D70AA|nr:hypothetical protein [Actinacidiphila yeochonensis]
MKTRTVLAAVLAPAAVPLVLLAAGTASASPADAGSATASATASASPEATRSAGTDTGTDTDTSAPATSGPTGGAPAESSTGTPTGTPTDAPSGSPGSAPTGPPTGCKDDDSLDVSFLSFPATITAGGPWKTVTLVARNHGDHVIRNVSPSLQAWALNAPSGADGLRVEYADPRTHRWVAVPHGEENHVPFAAVEVAAGAEQRMTLRVEALAAPQPDEGSAQVYGYWDNGGGLCGYTDGDQAEFRILASAPGSTPTTNAASPQSGGEAQLADTGAPWGTNVLLTAGGAAAVLVGGGAIAMGRRRTAARTPRH